MGVQLFLQLQLATNKSDNYFFTGLLSGPDCSGKVPLSHLIGTICCSDLMQPCRLSRTTSKSNSDTFNETRTIFLGVQTKMSWRSPLTSQYSR